MALVDVIWKVPLATLPVSKRGHLKNLVTPLFVLQILFKLDTRSTRMERVKIARYTRCGMMSSKGTDKGKLRNGGSRTVKTGINRRRFDG